MRARPRISRRVRFGVAAGLSVAESCWEVERMKPARAIVLAGRTVEEVNARRVAVSRTTLPAASTPPAQALDTAPARATARLGLVESASCRMSKAAFDDRSGQDGCVNAMRRRAANMSMPT
jgi:hypothetical protein